MLSKQKAVVHGLLLAPSVQFAPVHILTENKRLEMKLHSFLTYKLNDDEQLLIFSRWLPNSQGRNTRYPVTMRLVDPSFVRSILWSKYKNLSTAGNRILYRPDKILDKYSIKPRRIITKSDWFN
jgi:uncharacterized protein YfbU (UPF0304 family)